VLHNVLFSCNQASPFEDDIGLPDDISDHMEDPSNDASDAGAGGAADQTRFPMDDYLERELASCMDSAATNGERLRSPAPPERVARIPSTAISAVPKGWDVGNLFEEADAADGGVVVIQKPRVEIHASLGYLTI
jgi:hypothetical protein